MGTNAGPLGRLEPPDWKHREKYPLTALPAAERPKSVPVVIGINWYTDFDQPDGAGWIGRDPHRLGQVRGGHCVCLEPADRWDAASWQAFYDQGEEGACTGFGSSRCMSLLNRKRYDGFWLYHEARKVDEFPGEDYEGSTVRAAMDVLRVQGHVVVRGGRDLKPSVAEGIRANRWATDVDQVLAALGTPERNYVTILNSWGTHYPHRVKLPAETLAVLLAQDGEFAIPTDR